MNYYQIDTLACEDPDFVFLRDKVKGVESDSYMMAEGEAVSSVYPKNARLEMSRDSRGITLPSLIGNTSQLLIVHRGLKDILEGTGVPMEVLPFTLYNQKKRVASKDHFIVNPLGTLDCIDFKKSVIRYAKVEPTVIIAVDKLVLDGKKLKKAPDLFRIDRRPRMYVISEKLGSKLAALDPTNVIIHKLEVS
jgi:hypothetical protein